VPAATPTILATSGGIRLGERSRVRFAALVHHAVELAGVTGRAPRIAHLGTAQGDQRSWHAELDEAARYDGFDLSHLNLFPMPSVDDVEGYLMEQDVVWVGGGSVVNLLAVWRARGLDTILPRVWRAGVVLTGVSAGSICWHRGGTTDSFGPGLDPITNGLLCCPMTMVCISTRRSGGGRSCTGSWVTAHSVSPTAPTMASACSTAAPTWSRR
jgi:peptidase E